MIEKNPIQIALKRMLFIPLVGIVIPVLCITLGGPWGKTMATNKHIFWSIIFTAIIWTGCEIIHIFLEKFLTWKKGIALRIAVQLSLVTLWAIVAIIVLSKLFLKEQDITNNLKSSIFISVGTTIFINIVVLAIYFVQQWKKQIIINEQLQKENVISRYEALKNQVNPHFLFNSLNTLIGIIEENPHKAIAYTNSLSNVFRGLLQSPNKDVVPLKNELILVKEFVQLFSMRFENAMNISYQLSENSLDKKIPHLSLQMVVENCFKHNIISINKPLNITILNNDNFVIVQNNYQPKESIVSNGVGLQNIINRYQVLNNNAEVIIEQNNDTFIVKLPLL